MSESEIRTFVEDIAMIRLGIIVSRLNALESGRGADSPLASEPYIDWANQKFLAESGIQSEWIMTLARSRLGLSAY